MLSKVIQENSYCTLVADSILKCSSNENHCLNSWGLGRNELRMPFKIQINS